MSVLLSRLYQTVLTMARRQASGYISGELSTAFVTVPSMDVAKEISRKVVQEKLAACVNIIPQVTSVYEWEGKIEEDSELILMIKTATSKIDDLTQFVKKTHPYSCPEVISSQIDNGNPAYLDWVSSTVLVKGSPTTDTDNPDQ